MRILSKLLALFVVSWMAMSGSAFADERAKPDEAKAMLAKAVAYYKANGKDKSFAEFSKKDGSFIDRDLYVTAFDLTGKNLAHINPRMVGKDNINLQDAEGKFHIKERLEIAKAKGKGQQEFKFLNPMTKQIESKLMFFEKIDDVVLACGSYKPAD
jgi:cytochrome c